MSALIPVNISFTNWASQLRNSYPEQNIPRIDSDSDWQRFPAMLSSNRCFDDKYIPYIVGFDNWRDWASEFLLSIGA
jgi:hypothetical protein